MRELLLVALKRQTTRLEKLQRKRTLSAEERDKVKALKDVTRELLRVYKRRLQRHDKKGTN